MVISGASKTRYISFHPQNQEAIRTFFVPVGNKTKTVSKAVFPFKIAIRVSSWEQEQKLIFSIKNGFQYYVNTSR